MLTQYQALLSILNVICRPTDNLADRREWSRSVFTDLSAEALLQPASPWMLCASDSSPDFASKLDRVRTLVQLEVLKCTLKGPRSRRPESRETSILFIDLLE